MLVVPRRGQRRRKRRRRYVNLVYYTLYTPFIHLRAETEKAEEEVSGYRLVYITSIGFII